MKKLILALMLAFAIPAQAHHSFALNFDMNSQIEIRGTVVEFKLRSPHSTMVVDGISYIDGVAQENIAQRWEIESSASGGLRAMGIEPDTFMPGDEVSMIANPNREDGFRFVNSSTFTKGNETYSRARISPPETVSDSELDGITGIQLLEGRWSSPGAFGNGTPLPLNERGLEAVASFDSRLSPANTCEPMNFPDIYNAPYLTDLRIEDNNVVLYNVPWEVERRIPLNGLPVRPRIDGLFGVARATVQDNAIEVISGGFIPSRWGLGSATQKLGGGADIPSSARKTLTERYSVSEDGQTLIYEYTIRDPIFLSEPYSDTLLLNRVADSTPLYDYDCEVEAASMFSRTSEDASLEIGQ